MNVSDALRDIIASQRVTQSDIAKELGVSQPAIASVLSVGNPQFRVLSRIAGSVGYTVALVPKGADLPEGSYELEVTDKSSRH